MSSAYRASSTRSFPVTLRRGDGLIVRGWQGRDYRLVVGEAVTFHSAEDVGGFLANSVEVHWISWSWRGGFRIRTGVAFQGRSYVVEAPHK